MTSFRANNGLLRVCAVLALVGAGPVLAQTTPAAGTVTDIPANARLDVNADGLPDPAVVGVNAHTGFCALWAKQKEPTNGLVTNAATATDLIDDLTPLVQPSRSASLRDLLPIVDVYNDTVNGLHVPNFKMPWTAGCTSGGGDLGGTRFAVRLRGNLHIESAGVKTFMVQSDDGYQLTIGGQQVMAYNANRGPGIDTRRANFLQPGVYPIEIIYWDQGGIAVLETFMASSAICFNNAGTQGACAGAFTDASSVTTITSTTNFELVSNRRVAPATWAGVADTCAPNVGVGNATCSPPAAVACGNGVVEVVALTDGGTSTEACDDGNLTNGDGCSNVCGVEANYVCGPPQVSNCVPVPPVVTAPARGASLNTTAPTYSGTGVAGMQVTVSVDGTVVCTATVTAGGTWTCTHTGPALSIGAHQVTATQQDSAARVSAPSSPSTFTIDTSAPGAPVILVPAQNSTVGNSKPTISGTAEAGSLVRVYLDGSATPWCTTTATVTGTFSCAGVTALSEGVHHAAATATDAATNTSGLSPIRDFTVDTVAPAAPVISAPIDNSVLNTATPVLSGSAETGTTVTVFLDGSSTPYCTVVAAAPGVWACPATSTLAQGAHTARAVATDAGGNATPSAVDHFTVDTVKPVAPVITTPAEQAALATHLVTASGTAEAGTQVKVYVDGSSTVACTTTVAANGSWSCALPSLPDGAHTLTATSTDAANNVSPATAIRHFTIDTSAPATPVIVTPAEGAVLAASPTVTGTAEALSTITLYVDGSVTPACTTVVTAAGTWSCPLTGLAAGAHQVVALSSDAAGNVSSATPARHFSIDTTPPAVPVITAPAEGAVSATSPKVTGTAEAGSTVTVYLDGSTTPVCTVVASNTGAWSCQLSGLADGAHQVTAVATDVAGNASAATAARHFTIDTAAPAVPVITAPAEGAVSATSPNVTGTAEAGSTVTVFLDGSSTPVCTVVASNTGAWNCQLSGLADGAHQVTAVATDAASNASAATAPRHFTVDTTAPAAPVITAPTEGAVSSSSPTVTGTAEAGSTVTVFVDGSTTPACTVVASSSGSWTCPLPALPDGAHQVVAVATDPAGNASSSSPARGFVIDSSAPSQPSIAAPTQGSTTADSMPEINGLAEAGSIVSVYADGATTPLCTATADAQGHWSCTPTTALTDGAHGLIAVARDTAGNSSTNSTRRDFTVDTQGPAVPVLTAPAEGATTSASPTVSGSAEPGSTVSVFIDGSTTAACTAVADAVGSFSCVVPGPLATGAHTVTAQASDSVGNLSPSTADRHFTVSTSTPPGPPVISSPVSNSTTNDSTPTVSGHAAPGSEVRVYVDGSSTPACTATADATGAFHCDLAPALADGSHQVIATATTTAGTSAPSLTVPFIVDTKAPAAPTITSPSAGATTGSSPVYAGSAEPGSTVSVFVDGGATPVCTAVANAQGVWSCVSTTPLTPGAHSATASAVDAAGNAGPASTSVAFTVSGSSLPDAPVITGPAANAQLNDSTPVFSGTATPGATVAVSVDGTVVCTVIADAQGHFSCSPTIALSDGAHAVTATQSTSQGTSPVSSSVPFTIDTTSPTVPVITAPSAGSTTGNQPVITGTGEAGSTITVRVDGQPVCEVLVDGQGNWSCALTQPLPAGPHTVTGQASDPAGNQSAQSTPVDFVVAPVPRTPVLEQPAAGSTVHTTTPVFSGLAEPGSSVTVVVDGVTVCTAVTDSMGHFSCTATSPLTEGSHQVVVHSTSPGGSASSATTTFTVSVAPPNAPVLTTPAAGSSSQTQPVFSGTAEAGSTVMVSVDGTTVCTATADSTGHFSCTPTTPISVGTHSATATATNANGTSSPSTAVSFTVKGQPPTTTSPEGGTEVTGTPRFTGTGQPGSTVSVLVDGAEVCTAVVDDSGTFSCAPAGALSPGQHTVVVQGADGSTSEPVDFLVVSRSLRGAGLGCSSTSAGPLGWLLAAAALLALNRRRRHGLAAVVLVTAGAAQAQVAVPGFELERVRLNAGAQHGLLVESADLLPRFNYRAALTFHYQQDPLVLVEGAKRVGSLVGNRIGLHVSGAFSPTDWLEVAVQMPIILHQGGSDVAALGYAPVWSGVAAGTPWLGVRGGLLQERRGSPLDVSLGLALGIPLGSPAALTADSSVSVVPSIGLGKTLSSFLRLGGNVNVLVRNARTLSPGSTVTDEVGSMFSAGVVLSTLGTGLRGELSTRLDVPFTRTAVGAELDLGLRYPLFKLLEIYAVGGPGFGSLPGTPTFRILAGIALAPQSEPAPAVAEAPKCVEGVPYLLADCPELDRDGDGVRNGQDSCPEVLGVAARKGCADVDSDGDGVLDSKDSCPKVAGLAELSGCPEPDSDGDGVPDVKDACPAAAGPVSAHGCPDSDGDGLDDSVDACPKQAGVTDLKGCPDVDTDGDGVPDRRDACRTEAGVLENEGCPAKRKQLVVITKDKLLIKEKVYFATGKSSVLPRSFPLLEQVAGILKDHPEVEHMTIEGHTDNRGNRDLNVKLSQARAAMVREQLMKSGVDGARLTAVGFGPDRPVESNETDKGREANRRVDFVIVGAEVEHRESK